MKEHSTDEAPPGGFPAHGRTTFRQEGCLLISEAEGPFNLELVQALRRPVVEAAAPLAAQGDAWGHLSRFRRSALASPDALAALAGFLGWLKEQGMAPTFTAYVLGDEVEGARLMDLPLRRCFEAAGLHMATFADEDSARAWLLQALQGGKQA